MVLEVRSLRQYNVSMAVTNRFFHLNIMQTLDGGAKGTEIHTQLHLSNHALEKRQEGLDP